MDFNTEKQLIRILSDLNKIEGVDGSLIADYNGNVICRNISWRTNISLFGPMAHVITSSSKQLLNSANQGIIERILIESIYGKTLFLHLENVYFIVLMDINVNVGMVMVSAKRSAEKISELTKDFVLDAAESVKKEIGEEISIKNQIKVESNNTGENTGVMGAEDEIKVDSTDVEGLEVKNESRKEFEKAKIEPEIGIEVAEKHETSIKTENKILHGKEFKIEDIETQVEISEPIGHIPSIKPPISFPKLPENVKIPQDIKERSDLILDIYESIFLAMTIGASRIMGVSPARGLIKKFLPSDECREILDNVDVKSNSTVDFDKIRENIEKIPIEERENTLITDFSKIISIITVNYGRVMGYSAFRGIVRVEFKIINDSYGKAMDKLGIKEKIHPGLIGLFE